MKKKWKSEIKIIIWNIWNINIYIYGIYNIWNSIYLYKILIVRLYRNNHN